MLESGAKTAIAWNGLVPHIHTFENTLFWNPDNQNLKWNYKNHGIQGPISKKIPVIEVLIIEDLLRMANTSQFLFKIIVHT